MHSHISNKTSKYPRHEAGFTLIELLVVLVILGLLFGIVGPKFFGQTDKYKAQSAKIQIEIFRDALQQFEVDNGFYPSTEQGLDALVQEPSVGQTPTRWREGGYLDKPKIPLDPWDNPYIYISPGNHDAFDIISYGPDGEQGGEGKYADITSWEDE